jgi:mannose-6-phosphate isomerase
MVRISPKVGDAVFTPAGTVHSLGGDVMVFEIQENSDVTFRLYDWGHIDPKTGQPRPLQVEQAMASICYGKSAAGLVTPIVEATAPICREQVVQRQAFPSMAAARAIAVFRWNSRCASGTGLRSRRRPP